jgi:uncharacterized RDD family membrane protein YckC
MSSMPEDGAARQQVNGQGKRQGTVGPDVPAQANAPQDHSLQQPPQAPPPPQQQQYGQPAYGQAGTGQQPYGQPVTGQPVTGQPTYGQLAVVPREETKVTGRRVVQYIFDYIVAGIIPGLAFWLFDRNNAAFHGFGWLIATVIALAVYFVYWVVLPYGHRGQTFGMRLMRIHVIGKDGSKASMLQLFVRGVLLIVDTFVWGLVGLITILCSRHRQRVGDHVARTVVVPARYGAQT